MNASKLRCVAIPALLCSLVSAQAQDQGDWQSLAQLHPGDKIRLTLKSGSSTGMFQGWTPQQVTVGTLTAKREDVRKIELFSPRGGMRRSTKAIIGAAAGFVAVFLIALSARSGGCQPGHSFGPCPTGEQAAAFGGFGAGLGAIIGAALPAHPRTRQIVYLAKP